MTAYEMKRHLDKKKRLQESNGYFGVMWCKKGRSSGNDCLYFKLVEEGGPWGDSYDWSSSKSEASMFATEARAYEYIDKFNAWAKREDPSSQFNLVEL